MGQLLDGLIYMNKRNICHRDLKADNILLDDKFNIIISDFGFACALNSSEELKNYCGTTTYMPPEMNANNPRNLECWKDAKSLDGEKIDVFSLGVLLFILRIGCPPFYSAKPTDPYYRCFCSRRKNLQLFWKGHFRLHADKMPDSYEFTCWKDLIQKMLEPDPD